MSGPAAAPGMNDVHVWWIDLTQMAAGSDRLSREEQARAARFRHMRDRDQWIGARLALRQILARYTGDAPESLQFEAGPHGKPALSTGSPLRFTLTHARDRAALAIAWRREIGIDLAACCPDLPPEVGLAALTATTCTPSEAGRIMALPPAARHLAFLRHWVLKEALLKGIGLGLSQDPRTLEVLLHGDGRASVCGVERPPEASSPARHSHLFTTMGEGSEVRAVVGGRSRESSWTLRLLDAGAEWVAALACEGPDPGIVNCHWPRLSHGGASAS